MKLRGWIKVVLSLALMTYLIARYGLAIPLPKASNQLLWLGFPILFTIVGIPLAAGLRWQVFLKAAGISLPFKTIISINFRSIFWGMLLPSSDGFALIRCILAEKQVRADSGKATASVVAEKVLGMLCLGLLALAGSFFISASESYPWLRTEILLYLALITAFLVWVRYSKSNNSEPSGKILKFLYMMRLYLNRSLTGATFLEALPWVLAVQFASIATIYYLFRYMGIDLSFGVHLCYIPVIQVISLIPLTFSGFGIREGAFVLLYKSVCLDTGALITISVLSFVILTLIPALIGGLISLAAKEKLLYAV